MNKPFFHIRPGWHIPVVLVMTFALALPFHDMVSMHGVKMRLNGQFRGASYFAVLGPSFWALAFLIFLPRTGSCSRIRLALFLARVPLFVRWLMTAGLGFTLYGLGVFYERLGG